jgi:AcrR family transcriptional regulator
MANRSALEKRRKPAATGTRDDQRTRRQLIEEAGRAFAENGFGRTTGKEICARAGVNAAAVNYHFGSMTGLYAAVLQEAHNRLVTIDALTAAIASTPDPRARLRAVLSLFARSVTGPEVSSWVLRVLGREIVSPSPELKTIDEKVRLPKVQIVRHLIAELLELPDDHPAVARSCISVMGPCVLMLVGDRASLRRILPAMVFTPDSAEALIDHLCTFALAGLNAVAESVRKCGLR